MSTDARARFLAAVDAAAANHAAHPGADLRETLDGLAHSILCIIDGVTDACPGLDLVVVSHDDPDSGWLPGEVINDDPEYLHDGLGKLWRARRR